MPDPTSVARFVMISTPNIPQPYQARFLTALENSSRPETSSERWNRERNESLKIWNGAIRGYAIAATAMAAAFDRNYTFQPPPVIGRKRRARRARGRR
jgi:hypothetical protein